MKQSIWFILVCCALVLAGCGSSSTAPSSPSNSPTAQTTSNATGSNGVNVEIIYLNHLPARSVLKDVNTLLEEYGTQVQVSRYDFNSPEGITFAQEKGIVDHTPIVIFVNGAMEFTIAERTVRFTNFPGFGWSLDDLRHVLDQAIQTSKISE